MKIDVSTIIAVIFIVLATFLGGAYVGHGIAQYQIKMDRLKENYTMKKPRTIRGYISLIREIEKIDPSSLKGFDKLPEEEQTILMYMDGDISNYINEVESVNDESN